jgi:hypothetical protein
MRRYYAIIYVLINQTIYGEPTMKTQLDPSHIIQTATAFWGSKVLLTAVELDLFSTLGEAVMTASELGEALGLHPRGTYDFFDALVALRFLDRDADGPQAKYNCTEDGTGTERN